VEVRALEGGLVVACMGLTLASTLASTMERPAWRDIDVGGLRGRTDGFLVKREGEGEGESDRTGRLGAGRKGSKTPGGGVSGCDCEGFSASSTTGGPAGDARISKRDITITE
jgi:hypothetical protein